MIFSRVISTGSIWLGERSVVGAHLVASGAGGMTSGAATCRIYDAVSITGEPFIDLRSVNGESDGVFNIRHRTKTGGYVEISGEGAVVTIYCD